MSVRPFRDIKRKKTKVINVGKVKIGGDNPISVQSMTNTLTTDIKATIKQINDIAEEGADIVRVSCPDEDSTSSLKEIIKHVSIPVVADIHFHYKRAIEAAENGASCLRINPGNIGDETKIHEVLRAAKDQGATYAVVVDADGQMDASKIPVLFDMLAGHDLDLVRGSRLNPASGGDTMPLLRYAAARILALPSSWCARGVISDPLSGFVALRLSKLPTTLWRGFGYPMHLSAAMAAQGGRMGHVAVPARYPHGGTSHHGLHRAPAIFIALMYATKERLK